MPKGIKLALALLIGAAPAAAQPPREPTTYDRAIAAGYKALTLCSGIFNAGRTRAQIEALELKGIYPEYDRLLPTLTADVNETYQDVEVSFDPSLPPRRADWGPDGCTIMPIGWEEIRELSPHGGLVPGPEPADPRGWPLGDAGIAPRPAATLAKAVAGAFPATGPRTTGLVVVADGKVVAERYAEGFGPFTASRTWSVAKSLAGTLVGLSRIDPRLPAEIPEWQNPGDPRAEISWDQLLRMASGLHSDSAGNRTDAIYFGGTAVTEQVTGWPLEAVPGTRFRYANNDILLAIRGLRAAFAKPGEDVGLVEYAGLPRRLFGPLGMRHTVAEVDWRGNYILSSQVWSTARDLARFGLLYLNDGVWNGERLLPKGWRDYVTRPSGPQPDGEFGYGATFWLMNKSPGVPADTFAAFGNRGQYVVIVPSRKIVIVRRGEDPAGARFDVAKFTAGILAALRP